MSMKRKITRESSRKSSRDADPAVTIGAGGEVHQQADGTVPVLTTQQGIPVADDQNSLKVGGRGPTILEDFPPSGKVVPFRS